MDWVKNDDVKFCSDEKQIDSSRSQEEHNVQEDAPGPENWPEGHAKQLADPDAAV